MRQELKRNNKMISLVCQQSHYLNSLSGDPAEPVDEAEYLDEVEREAREFFCHGYFNIMHELDTVDINLTIRIPQMSYS